MIGAIRKYTTAFGRFWWDFLVGDTPELFVGVLVIIGAALALRHERAAAITVVPLLTVAFLAASTYRARNRA
ncbi:MAG: hypothetical protein JWO62_1758 [Acidimicrobiaceae bacterium]|jgi:ABC-type spermidine/putrescine transport system permease subunit I|nr:hypothetical protein [Acidimicrobiaceae bacterium]